MAGIAALTLSMAAPVFAAVDITEPIEETVNSTNYVMDVGNITTDSQFSVNLKTHNGHTATLKTMNIESQQNGVYLETNDNASDISLTINGYLKAKKGAIGAMAQDDNKCSITVTGNISSEDSMGISAQSGNNGKLNISVGGNITSGHIAITSAFTDDNGNNTIIVKGDVSTTASINPAIWISTPSNDSVISNIAIEGTLSGGNYPLAANADIDAIYNIAIWKIALKDGHFGCHGVDSTTYNEKLKSWLVIL